MSRKGVFGAVVFFLAFCLFVAGTVAFDVYLDKTGGDAATITYGVRWLTFHMPWTVMMVVGAISFMLGFLTCHFWSQKIVENPPGDQ